MLNPVDQAFHDTYNALIQEGHLKHSRTGVDTLMLPAQTLRFDLTNRQQPWLSTKLLRDKKSREEMFWFISGSSSIKFLRDHNNGIWDSWHLPGTAKYEEPSEPFTLQRMIDMALEKGTPVEAVRAVIAGYNYRKSIGAFGGQHFTLDGEEHYIGQGYDVEGVILQLAKKFGLPTHRNMPTRIGVALRLTRVPRKDFAAWDKINQVIFYQGYAVEMDKDYAPIKITTFTRGKYQPAVLHPKQEDAVHKVLDDLDIPAYALLDADIGPGGYGPSWRTWKDTQLVDSDNEEEVQAHFKEGYFLAGDMDHCLDGKNYSVFTREIDQLQNCINTLRKNPDDRRIIVTAWNPALTWKAALPPCHLYFQFMTFYRKGGEVLSDLCANALYGAFYQTLKDDYGSEFARRDFAESFDSDMVFREKCEEILNRVGFRIPARNISCLLVMRSSDTPLGLPFNISQYALLVNMVAHVTNMEPHELIWVGADTHIYVNQIEAIKEQLSRESMPDSAPVLRFKRRVDEIDHFQLDDIEVTGYTSHPFIEIPFAV